MEILGGVVWGDDKIVKNTTESRHEDTPRVTRCETEAGVNRTPNRSLSHFIWPKTAHPGNDPARDEDASLYYN